MNYRYAAVLAALIVGIVTCQMYLQWRPPSAETQHTGAVSVDPLLTAATIVHGEATDAADLAALREEVASIRAEVRMLRSLIPPQTASATARADGQPAAMRSDPSARAEAAREHQVEMEAVDAAFRKQVTDPSWSANTTTAIREALGSEEMGGMQAENIDCRSSSCRVELHDDGSGHLSNSLPTFVRRLAEATPTIRANTIPQADGTSVVVLYMSREKSEEQPPS
jgi:hypothetical protein